MHLGIFSYNTDYGARPDELAQACEARGFESLWVGEHTHIPASRQTPYPGGDPQPKPYYHMADPFVSLAMAAAVTTKLKLGTGICLVTERDPIVLAKEVATLDHLSDAQVIEGDGAESGARQVRQDVVVHAAAGRRPWQQHDVWPRAAGTEMQLAAERVRESHEQLLHGPVVCHTCSFSHQSLPFVVGAKCTRLMESL